MKNSAKYLEIAINIKKKIFSNMYKSKTLLPSEKDLCAEYEVSRETMKRAINKLVLEGYLYTVPGKGTFVFDNAQDEYKTIINNSNFFINGFTNAKLIFANIIKPDIYDVYYMNIAPNENIISMKWIILRDEKPIAYDIKNMLYTTGVAFEEEDLKYSSLQDIVLERFPNATLKQNASFNVVSAPPEISKQLKLAHNNQELAKIQIWVNDRNDDTLGWNIIYILPEEFQLIGESKC